MTTNTLFRLTPVAFAVLASSLASALTLPTNPVLMNGAAVISQTATGLNVANQPGTILNWDSFSIGAGRTVNFDQLGPGSAVLNRVTGNTRSDIIGALTSNGRVFLLNPNGVLFGQGARVDVQGLVASTLALSDADFLAGNYRFVCANGVSCDFGAPDALNPTRNKIVLADGAQITTRTAGNGGQVWLIARGAVETAKGSTIDVPLGQVAMAAGREVVVTSPSLGAISFTLDRIAGTTLDLAGDIDVERGAAGFFADSIRFGGKVLARSATDGAGQIVASAGSRIDVDDDARLDVSGAATADAGAVRLNAVQTIRVSAAAEIAADGGSFTATQAGGRGGLIDLEAAEVNLPWLLGNGLPGPVQLHARGTGASGLDLARYGTVTVRETGNFDYSVSQGPTFHSTLESDFFSSRGSSNHQVEKNQSQVESISVSGDGRVLLLTVTETESTNGFGTGDDVFGITHTENRSSFGTRYEAQIVDATGNLIARAPLSDLDGSVETINGKHTFTGGLSSYSAEVVGLTKGGWVIKESGRNNANRLVFIDAAGAIQATVAIAEESTIRPLLSGGVLVSSMVDALPQQTVHTAQGLLISDASAILSGENLQDSPLLNSAPTILSFDERNTRALQADLNTRSGAFSSPVAVNGAELVPRDTSVGSPFEHEVISQRIGFLDNGEAFVPVLLGSAETTHTEFPILRASPPVQSFEHDTESTTRFSNFRSLAGGQTAAVLGSGQVALFTQTGESTGRSSQLAPSGQFRLTEATSRGRGDNQLTYNVITRTLDAPFAAQGIAASYLALAGAGTPGVSNGSANPPVSPPVTPPVNPPVDPGNPVIPVTPVPPLNGTGLILDIRPPQTELVSLTRASLVVPSTARPSGPNAMHVIGSGMDPAELSEQGEIALYEELIKNEFGPEAAEKFREGNQATRERMAREVYSKQTFGDYWEVIGHFDEDMRQLFFEAMGDLQLQGEFSSKAVATGFMDAIFWKRSETAPDDGSVLTGDQERTAMERTLLIYQTHLAQARTPEQRQALRQTLAEDMLDIAKDVAAKDAPKRGPKYNPAVEVDNESLFVDEAKVKADVEAQRRQREADAAAPAEPAATPAVTPAATPGPAP